MIAADVQVGQPTAEPAATTGSTKPTGTQLVAAFPPRPVAPSWPATEARRSAVVEVDGSPVRVKVGPGRVKVEHDDAARVARRTGLPVREVVSRAEEAWRREGTGEVVELPGPPDPQGDAG